MNCKKYLSGRIRQAKNVFIKEDSYRKYDILNLFARRLRGDTSGVWDMN